MLPCCEVIKASELDHGVHRSVRAPVCPPRAGPAAHTFCEVSVACPPPGHSALARVTVGGRTALPVTGARLSAPTSAQHILRLLQGQASLFLPFPLSLTPSSFSPQVPGVLFTRCPVQCHVTSGEMPVLPDPEGPRGQPWGREVVSAWTVLGGSRTEISRRVGRERRSFLGEGCTRPGATAEFRGVCRQRGCRTGQGG